MSHKVLPPITVIGPLIAVIVLIAGLSSILPARPWQSDPLVSPLKLVADRDEAGFTTITRVGDTITYTLILTTSSAVPVTASLTDTVGNIAQLTPGSAIASAGLVTVTGNTLAWTGPLAVTQPVTIAFRALLTTTLPPGPLVNTATVGLPGGGITATNRVTTTLVAEMAYLPIVVKPRMVYLPIAQR